MPLPRATGGAFGVAAGSGKSPQLDDVPPSAQNDGMAKQKNWALSSLAVAGGGLLLTWPFHATPAGGFVQAAFEASLVGGLADWYAVTALFRHPLGLRLPHSAVILKNRSRVTDGVVHLVEREWLSASALSDHIRSLSLVEAGLRFLESSPAGLQPAGLGERLYRLVVGSLQNDPFFDLLEDALRDQARDLPLRDLVQSGVEWALRNHLEDRITDLLLAEAISYLREMEFTPDLEFRMRALADRILTWKPAKGLLEFFGVVQYREIFEKTRAFGLYLLDAPETREGVRQRVLSFLHALPDNASWMRSLAAWKDEVLDQVALRPLLTGLFSALEHPGMPQRAAEVLRTVQESLVRRLRQDAETRELLEKRLRREATSLVERNHHRIGAIVRENLDRLSDQDLIALIEGHVGADLQWIRINGAVVGGMIGILLHGLTLFLATIHP